MYPYRTLLYSLLLNLLSGGSQAQSTSCNSTNRCGDTAPCCSEYGFCGAGSFCLGGCNPLSSSSIRACEPNPVCQDATYTFDGLGSIYYPSSQNPFDGNADRHAWVLDTGNITSTNSSGTGGELLMILTKSNGGTRLSSTRFVHYGTITAKLKTTRWTGVVTAFITMSGIKDEIDWEFPGNRTSEAQTNFFWQGYVPVGEANNGNIQKGLTDTSTNFHDYTIDWQPKQLNFLIDGQVVRTVNRDDTKDKTGIYRYPSTPSRIQLSLWPAGIETSAPGTVQWAGGMINWEDPDYIAKGQFSATVQSITVKCADSSSRMPGVTGYTYDPDATMKNPTVDLVNGSTVIGNSAPSLDSEIHLRGALGLLALLALATCLL